jgi:capsular exopolysaccharide synthesis family protein
MAVADQLVSLVAPSSMEANQYRGLRHTVERLHRDSGLQVVAVTSPGAGEGKTITTLNLAASLAQSAQTRVLVIDADLHRPSVGKYLGIAPPYSPGLSDVIASDDGELEAATRRIESFNLSVVLAGGVVAGPYELLNSARLELLLKEARNRYDYVLIDTPPVVPLPDSRLLAQWVDGFLIVVAAHKTPRKALAEALNLVDSGKTIGMVFNGDDRPLSPYSSYYGYYGQQSDSAPSSNTGSRWWRSRKPAKGPQ